MITKFSKFFLANNKLIINSLRCLNSTNPNSNKNVAIILSGCGVYDGSEITEAVSAMIHLSRHNANIEFFAPNIDQQHVVNHMRGELEPEKRNVLYESARIARGNIKSLDKLKAADFNALIVPGGFGAAKNLSDFAVNGIKFTINPEVERVIKEFVIGLKPLGFCCIAPILPAKLLPACSLTVGCQANAKQEWPYAGTIDNLKQLGACVIEKDVNEIVIDEKYKVVTTPAYMKNASFFEVFTGIGLMIDQVIKMCD